MAAAAIPGVSLAIDAEPVVLTSGAPLAVVSSAVLGGGTGAAGTIVKVRVPRDFVRRRRSGRRPSPSPATVSPSRPSSPSGSATGGPPASALRLALAASDVQLGALAARAARTALEAGVRRWLEEPR